MAQVQREREHQHAEEGENVHDQRSHSVWAEKRHRFNEDLHPNHLTILKKKAPDVFCVLVDMLRTVLLVTRRFFNPVSAARRRSLSVMMI